MPKLAFRDAPESAALRSYSVETLSALFAKMARAHNNANVLTLAGRYTDEATAAKIVDAFLSTSFEGGRHQRRVDEIADIENGEGG